MKALLCWAIIIWSIGNLNAQPLEVEWERIYRFSNDTLQGIEVLSVVEQSASRSLFLFGRARSLGHSAIDSSDAFVMRVDRNGDSLWTRLYDDDDPPLEWFSHASELPTGELVTGVYYPVLTFLDLDGNIYDWAGLRCESNWLGPVEELAIGPDGRIYAGARCVVSNNGWEEHATLICVSGSGDSLWTVSRQYSRYNHVEKIKPAIGGGVLAMLWSGSPPYAEYLLAIDSLGNVLSEFELSRWAADVISIGRDTIVYAYNVSPDRRLRLRKVNISGVTIAEREFDLDMGVLQMGMSRDGRRIRVRSDGGYIAEFSLELDSLWSYQLPDEFRPQVERRSGGFVTAISEIDNNFEHIVRLIAYFAPRFPLITMTQNVDFGQVEIGESATRTVEIVNPGGDSVLVESFTLPIGFTASIEPPFWVHFEETLPVEVTFAPEQVSAFVDTMYVTTDSPYPPIRIALWASGIVAVNDERSYEVRDFGFASAFPNPFNAVTTLSFEMPREADVVLSVFDVQGRLVSEVARGTFAVGRHSVAWSCADCASGIYFATMNAGEFSATLRLLLLK